jgi:hypothetical protein
MRIKISQISVAGISTVVFSLLGLQNELSATSVAVSQSNISLFSGPSIAVSVNTAAKLGYFVGGFTPTLANITDWDENFRGFNGYWRSSTKQFAVTMVLGDNNVGGGTQTGATGFGKTNTVGSQLYLIGSSSAYNGATATNSVLNADYVGATSSTPVFVLTDPSWIIPTTSSLDTGAGTTFFFTANTALAAFGGTTLGSSFAFNPATQTGSLVMIPEPSCLSLGAVGLISVLALCRRKNSVVQSEVKMRKDQKAKQK